MDFHTADPAEVLSGRVTDVYFQRTAQTLRSKGLDLRVRAEFFAKILPGNHPWAVLCGAQDVVSMIDHLKLPVSVRALPEGTIFRAGAPILEIEGKYLDFGQFETTFLGLLCQASGVATRAARARLAADGRPVICFGARRVHPIVAPAVERYAYLGGTDGVAAVLSAERIGLAPSGTVPHALILLFGDTVQAARAFHEAIPGDVPRVVLVDTFRDERFEALRVAEALGPALAGVRLDTPSSRRGNFLQVLQEVRWELDLRGFKQVKIFVSGGIGEREILELNPAADSYGVGTYLTAAPPLDASMDLVEVDGRAMAKRGKHSGSKSLWRCQSCRADRIAPRGEKPDACKCGGPVSDLMTLVYEDGHLSRQAESPDAIRGRVIEQLDTGPFAL